MHKWTMRAGLLVVSAILWATAAAAQSPQTFDDWLADLLAEARGRGYSDELLDADAGRT